MSPVAHDPKARLRHAAAASGKATAKAGRVKQGAVHRRWGVVTAFNPLTDSLDIDMGGATIGGLSSLSSYQPIVGDTVALDVVHTPAGADVMIVGSVTSYADPAGTGAASGGTTDTGGAVGVSGWYTPPTDTSTPAQPAVTLLAGIQQVSASWVPVTTANGTDVATYTAQIATDPLFTQNLQTYNAVGPLAVWTGLQSATTYYVQVQPASYANINGPWSTAVSITTPQAQLADMGPGSVGSVQLIAGSILAGSAVIGTAAISAAQIASLTANQITTGTMNAQTISLGTAGGTAAISSVGFVAGSTGWGILGDGSAYFANVQITGEVIATEFIIPYSASAGGTINGKNMVAFQTDGSGTLGAYIFSNGGQLQITSASGPLNISSNNGAVSLSSTTGGVVLGNALQVNGSTNISGNLTAAGIWANPYYLGQGPSSQPIFLATYNGAGHTIYFGWNQADANLVVVVDYNTSTKTAGATRFIPTNASG